MTNQYLIQEAARSIADKLELQIPTAISEEAMLQLLETEISNMLRGSGEAFFSLMYRLDISETKLQDALADREAGVSKVAKLIFDRQIQKAKSRENNRHGDLNEGEEDLKW